MADGPEGFKELGRWLSNWGRWGDEDQLGTLNLITPERIVAAAGLVKRGVAFDLGMALDDSGPQTGVNRRNNAIHMMTIIDENRPAGMMLADDMAVLSLQAATQWDALAHVGYDGYTYNGALTSEVTTAGATRNSIDKLGARVVGRGVLLDVARSEDVRRLDGGFEVTPEILERVEREQGVRVGSGDIVIVRTGWQTLLHDGEAPRYMKGSAPGLGLGCCEWLHEREVAAVAGDTQAVEVKPPRDPVATHPVHMVLLRDMGMTVGEMFELEELATDCAADGIWEFLFSAQPLKITGAVGSPITPVAIK